MGSSGAQATVVEPFSLPRLLQQAPLIVHARVHSVEASPLNGGQRRAVLRALEILRAPSSMAATKEFGVPLLNRVSADGRSVYRVGWAPEFRTGEELVAFLLPRPEGDFALLGFHQGKVRVVEDERGVRRVLSWDQAPEPPLSDAELVHGTRAGWVRAAPLQGLMTLDELLNLARRPP